MIQNSFSTKINWKKKRNWKVKRIDKKENDP